MLVGGWECVQMAYFTLVHIQHLVIYPLWKQFWNFPHHRLAHFWYGRPEESTPVWILEDIRQDPRQQTSAAQYGLSVSLTHTAWVSVQHEPFHCLQAPPTQTLQKSTMG